MRLVDLEEWRLLQAIQPHLLRAAQLKIKETGISEAASHLSLSQYRFLCCELRMLAISLPASQDFDQVAIYQLKEEATELLKKVYPTLLKILPDDSSLLHIQKLRGLQAFGLKNKVGHEKGDLASLEALSLSDVDSILPVFTSFNERIESKYRVHLREATSATESSKWSNATLNEKKRAMIDAILTSLEQHIACCQRRDKHHLLLQGAGKLWHAEMDSLISLLLSSCGDSIGWQEIDCLPDKNLPRDEHKRKLEPLQSLCKDIANAQTYKEVLPLSLSEGALYKPPRGQKRTERRALVQVETLKVLIERQCFSPIRPCSPSPTDHSPMSFTIKEKRELSLNIAWCFLYLFNCPWTDNSWSADTISLLLSTSGSSSSLEFETPPYIRCDPKYEHSEMSDNIGTLMNDSVFLALGQLLVEMELGRRITPTELNGHGQSSLWLTLNNVLSEDGMLSACDDYLKAIEGCLELHRSIAELTPEEWAEESAKLIYDAIVVNLEKDFEHYRKRIKRPKHNVSPSLTGLKLAASPLADAPVAQIAKPLKRKVGPEYEEGFGDTSAALSRDSDRSGDERCPGIQPEINIVDADQRVEQTPKRPRVASQNRIATRTLVTRPSLHADSKRSTSSSISRGFIQVYDDIFPHTAVLDIRAVASSESFLMRMDSFLELNLPTVGTGHKGNHEMLRQRARVCIIDTGFDARHPALIGAQLNGTLKGMKSFKGDPSDLNDEIGHGTHMAELVTLLAPEAELYIAKVAVANMMPQEDTKLIIEAIHWAVEQNVDIISLSLGLDVRDSALELAINEAIRAGKIVIAAAGNDWNNKPRAYPGSDRNVLCIHASNGKGKEGGISPIAWGNDDNFMTLGTAIPLIWKDKKGKYEKVVKFGTSFATAVAAAIAADVLAVIPRVVELTADQLGRLYSSSGMRSIFDLLSTPDNGYKYVAPWNLWDGNKPSTYIEHLILDALKR